MTFKVFKSSQMSNDEYHDRNSWVSEYISGSVLAEVMSTSPASWRFREHDDKAKPLVFGTQSHTNFESTDLFNSTYMRAPSPDDIKDPITSATELARRMKDKGIKGTSGKQMPELLRLAVDNDFPVDNVMWLREMKAVSEAYVANKELVKAEDFDACVSMRKVLESIPDHAKVMNSKTAQREYSIFGEIGGVKVKVRLDHVDIQSNVTVRVVKGYGDFNEPMYDEITYPKAIVITDYKTTASANPDDFNAHAFKYGYYLKMALQHDLFRIAHPDVDLPIVVRLLAQEKKKPFLPLAFTMDNEQLKIGQLQYEGVIKQLALCIKYDVWPSYNNGVASVGMETPRWVRNQFINALKNEA